MCSQAIEDVGLKLEGDALCRAGDFERAFSQYADALAKVGGSAAKNKLQSWWSISGTAYHRLSFQQVTLWETILKDLMFVCHTLGRSHEVERMRVELLQIQIVSRVMN
ncbi:hypothetical protein CYMTET_18702 [Cymbomonas tetramitiformis]|uniref:Uncharacterized protein n=1 Tax=Cymbomonas tetramitiformis TaxID=36881 RepID=A0AAE0G7L7_9CHLO|nr:hypothetical protein CYMTET_18702 [Cymbomonas tetramitiformis]